MTTQPLPQSTLPPQHVARLIALADDELLIGHRHSEWLGLSPFLEEDLTTASIAQDELGHARSLYALVWPDATDRNTSDGNTSDRNTSDRNTSDRNTSVMQRPPENYRSCDLVERIGSPWELALVRHWLYDAAEILRWDALDPSAIPGLESVRNAVRQEERFHRRHAEDLVVRLCRTPEGRSKIQPALDALWADALSMLADEAELIPEFIRAVRSIADPADLVVPQQTAADSDRHRRHPDFAAAHGAFVEVFAIDPEATW
jgi:ring-1,2-phenylacetyl-CoA epoxidase subunit PaaC